MPLATCEMREEESVIFILVILVGLSPCYSFGGYAFQNPAAKLGTSWKDAKLNSLNFSSFLSTRTGGSHSVFCGLICRDHYSCMFSVFVDYSRGEIMTPELHFAHRILWTANRNRMVQKNATVEFAADGNLVLLDVDGSLVWATNTSNKGAVTMNLASSSNLMLLDSNKNTVWQSFDHPTDVLTPGQEFKRGMQLIGASDRYGDHSKGDFRLEIQQNQLVLYAFGSPQQPYWIQALGDNNNEARVLYNNSSLEISSPITKQSYFSTDTESFHYLQLQSDGNIQVHAMLKSSWAVVYDLYRSSEFVCKGAGVCGTYGLCIQDRCTCPQVSSGASGDTFSFIDSSKPELGCKPSIPLINDTSQHMVQLKNYVPTVTFDKYKVRNGSSAVECKNTCLFDPVCKISVYIYGTCFPFDRVYTFTTLQSDNRLSEDGTFLKMQNAKDVVPSLDVALPPSSSLKRVTKGTKWVTPVIISSSMTGFFLLVLGVYFILRVRRHMDANTVQNSIPGLPNEFSYRQLQICTKSFSKKIGQGGFGTVFHGVMSDGIPVAVKKLESANQGEQQFEAEVCTIGSIHHMNLVKLHGFCTEGDHRLLVYEFLPNGSLDEWIFDGGGGDKLLDWATRFSIVLGAAKGLAYLHEECRERIIHLDIKPQNILLDGKFVAKVSDFGLSKLVDKDQSEIMTRMRGTPGYLAPEWLHSKITAKADVYSYGIVLLEIVCGRKCIDYECEDEDRAYLPAWVNRHVSRGTAVEVIDGRLKGAFNCEEATRALNVGLWCIQDGASVRPSMTNVVEMLKGISAVADPPIVHSNKLSRAFCEFVKSLSV